MISVDLMQYDTIKLLSSKCLESAVFWHMNVMARQIKIWIHHNRLTLSPLEENISPIVEQGFELNIYFLVSVDIFTMFHILAEGGCAVNMQNKDLVN